MLAYLSRYTHRVAISNSRLIAATTTASPSSTRIIGSTARPIQDDDAHDRRVHPPLPHPRPPQPAFTAFAITACSPKALAPKISRAREPARCGCTTSSRMMPMPTARCPSLPTLRRPHDRHRDLRTRPDSSPSAEPPNGRRQDRYFMRTIVLLPEPPRRASLLPISHRPRRRSSPCTK